MQNLISNFEALSEKSISEFAGQWIAIVDGGIIAHGRSFVEFQKVLKEKHLKERPLITKLPEASLIVLSAD